MTEPLNHKEQGNEQYKEGKLHRKIFELGQTFPKTAVKRTTTAGNWLKAAALYSKGLKEDPKNAVLLR